MVVGSPSESTRKPRPSKIIESESETVFLEPRSRVRTIVSGVADSLVGSPSVPIDYSVPSSETARMPLIP